MTFPLSGIDALATKGPRRSRNVRYGKLGRYLKRASQLPTLVLDCRQKSPQSPIIRRLFPQSGARAAVAAARHGVAAATAGRGAASSTLRSAPALPQVTPSDADSSVPRQSLRRNVSSSARVARPPPSAGPAAAEARSIAEQQAQSGPSRLPFRAQVNRLGWRPVPKHAPQPDNSAWERASLFAETSEEPNAATDWIARVDSDAMRAKADDAQSVISADRREEQQSVPQNEPDAIRLAAEDAVEAEQEMKADTVAAPIAKPRGRATPFVPRKPAPKSVLTGGVSVMERKERADHIYEVTRKQGLLAAQAIRKQHQDFDDARRKDRRLLMKKLKPYMEENSRLIELESDTERYQVEERRGWTAEMLAAEGLMLTGLEGYWLRHNDGTNTPAKVTSASDVKAKSGLTSTSSPLARIAVLQRPGKGKLGWTRLQRGDFVELRDERTLSVKASEEAAIPAGESCEAPAAKVPAIGTIRFINDHEIRLAFKEPVPDIDLVRCPSWRIDSAYNDTVEQRLLTSVGALAHDVASTSRSGMIVSGTYLTDLLLERKQARADLEGEAAPAPIAQWIDKHRAGVPKPDVSGLTTTQRAAVELMLRERISLIQGPPGTGKTSTIVAAIRILKQHYQIPHSILLTSHTNVAVDNLAQGCKEAGLKVVRAGPIARVRDGLLDITVDGLMDKHPGKSRLDDVDALRVATIKALQVARQREYDAGMAGYGYEAAEDYGEDVLDWESSSAATEKELNDSAYASILSKESPAQLSRRLNRLVQRAYTMRREIEADIFADADVVVSTALSAPLLQAVDFPLVFFDEATMATEPITIATMIKGCQQLALIGDHKQLSPLICSQQAKEEGLGGSLFERLMARGDIESVMLDTQHRMHPSLAAFPGKEFYHSQLQDGAATKAIEPLKTSFRNRDGGYLNFVHHTGREKFSRGDKSLENKTDAEMVVRLLADLLVCNPDLSGSDIAVITPYAGQKELLSRALRLANSSHLRRIFLRELELRGGAKAKARVQELETIEIETIDGFEGREKRAIIYSLTRSNASGYMGFLSNHKRWNVALTRARRGLWLVGNLDMLEKARQGDKSPSSRSKVVTEEDLEKQARLEATMDAEDEAAEHAGFLPRLAQHLRVHGCVVDAGQIAAPASAKK